MSYSDERYEENPDDFLLGNCLSQAEKDADAIEKDNRFLPVPPGEQILVVAGFFGAPQGAYHKVFVGGVLTGFDAYAVSVKFALASNPKATISDRFILPPSGDAATKAYFCGVPEASGDRAGTPSKMPAGILGNRFAHFINRLGYTWGPGQPFPLEAQRLGSWKGRMIRAEVKAGAGTYKAKDGTEKSRDNSIAWFSYKVAAPGSAAPPGGQAASSAASSAGASLGGAQAAATLAASDVV
jgi:hypothetical protein